MEKFKAVVSRIEIPDGIAIEALRNTLWVHSKFREDLYQNPTTSLQDAITRSDNFIRMEKDTNAILSKMNALKAPAAKNVNTRQEPRQHAPTDKNGSKDGCMYVVNENNVPVLTLVVRGEGWNKWVRELDSSDKPVDAVCSIQTTTAAGSAAGPSRTRRSHQTLQVSRCQRARYDRVQVTLCALPLLLSKWRLQVRTTKG
ncbi:hypothetical protein F2Q69_00008575 [Brassica cretica]|uniref:Uncharacterized protein n=1 Tax=Brassica cretica TaxID=69181 RepID=A0A8S9P5Y6_BRACR|nr:hypothetical protein F2Q69_00008575 [Brassica cretica]